MKRTIKILGIAALVVAVLAVAATITFAQDDNDAVSPGLRGDLESRPTPPGFDHPGRGRGPGMGSGLMFDTLAGELGMTPAEILAELQEGISIAQLAENHGVNLESLIDVLVGKAREMITEHVNKEWEPRNNWNRMILPGMRGDPLLVLVAEALDMTVQQVVQELRTGVSIADLVAGHDGDLDEIILAHLAQYQDRLDQAVENGRIDQEQAAAMMEEMAARIEEMVQTPWTEKSLAPGGAPCRRPGGLRGGKWQQPGFDDGESDSQGSSFSGPRRGGVRVEEGSSL